MDPRGRFGDNDNVVEIDDGVHVGLHLFFRNLNMPYECVTFLLLMAGLNGDGLNKQSRKKLIKRTMARTDKYEGSEKKKRISKPCVECEHFPQLIEIQDIHYSVKSILCPETHQRWTNVFGDIDTIYEAVLFIREISSSNGKVWGREELRRLREKIGGMSKNGMNKNNGLPCMECPNFSCSIELQEL